MAQELRMVAISPAVGIPPTPETYVTSFTPAAGTDDETIASPDEIVMEMVVEDDLCAYISKPITQRTYTKINRQIPERR